MAAFPHPTHRRTHPPTRTDEATRRRTPPTSEARALRRKTAASCWDPCARGKRPNELVPKAPVRTRVPRLHCTCAAAATSASSTCLSPRARGTERLPRARARGPRVEWRERKVQLAKPLSQTRRARAGHAMAKPRRKRRKVGPPPCCMVQHDVNGCARLVAATPLRALGWQHRATHSMSWIPFNGTDQHVPGIATVSPCCLAGQGQGGAGVLAAAGRHAGVPAGRAKGGTRGGEYTGVGIKKCVWLNFLWFVSSSTRMPHVAYVQMSKRNRTSRLSWAGEIFC